MPVFPNLFLNRANLRSRPARSVVLCLLLAGVTARGVSQDAPVNPPQKLDGYLQVDFARLADFKIDVPGFDPEVKPAAALAAVEKQLPESVRALDGQPAQISGFMLPVKMDGMRVKEFLLMRSQMMCCYGVVPRMNEWVIVRAASTVKFTPDVPTAFRGKLRVKPMEDQGFLTGVYLLEDAGPGK